jgi:hypothetical protein
MSDDTPTERFDVAGDAPTERLTPAAGETVPLEVVEERKSRKLILTLGIIGGLLLIGVIILLVALLTRGGTPTALPTDSASPTPSSSATATSTPTPSATPTPTATQTQAPPPPPPPDNSTAFTNFIPEKTVECYYSEAPNFDPPPLLIEVSWTSKNAVSAWFAQNVPDAADTGYMQIPVNGDESDFPYDQEYPCYQPNNSYTITIVGPNGEHVTKRWTVTNEGHVTN